MDRKDSACNNEKMKETQHVEGIYVVGFIFLFSDVPCFISNVLRIKHPLSPSNISFVHFL